MPAQPARKGGRRALLRPEDVQAFQAGAPTARPTEAPPARYLEAAQACLAASEQAVAAAQALLAAATQNPPAPPAPPPAYPDDPHWATYKAAAAHIGCAPSTLYARMAQAPPAVRQTTWGGVKRVSLVDLDRWLAETT